MLNLVANTCVASICRTNFVRSITLYAIIQYYSAWVGRRGVWVWWSKLLDRDGNSKIFKNDCWFKTCIKKNKMTKNVQSTLPDTLDTNSWITRVFPVPHAISRTRAPLAHASRQSCWHCLKGGTSPVPSAGEGSPALSLTRSMGTKGIEGKKRRCRKSVC